MTGGRCGLLPLRSTGAPHREERHPVPTSDRPLLLLLLVLVVALVLGALAYLSYEHPALTEPLTLVLAGAAVLVPCIALTVTRR